MPRLPFSSTYASLGLSAFIFCASCAFPVWLYLSIENSLIHVAEVNGDIEQAGVREKQVRVLKQRAAATSVQRQALEPLSIDKDDAAVFIGSIESTAREAGVKLEIGAVDIGGETSGRLQILSMQTRVDGSLGAVMTFLKLVEVLPKAAAVSGVSLERNEKAWRLNVLIKAAIKTSV